MNCVKICDTTLTKPKRNMGQMAYCDIGCHGGYAVVKRLQQQVQLNFIAQGDAIKAVQWDFRF